MDEKMGNEKKPHRTVYAIVEKPGLRKAIWMKLGIAHVNHDQSINVYLDAVPLGGKLQIREEDPQRRWGNKSDDAALPALDFGGSIQ